MVQTTFGIIYGLSDFDWPQLHEDYDEDSELMPGLLDEYRKIGIGPSCIHCCEKVIVGYFIAIGRDGSNEESYAVPALPELCELTDIVVRYRHQFEKVSGFWYAFKQWCRRKHKIRLDAAQLHLCRVDVA